MTIARGSRSCSKERLDQKGIGKMPAILSCFSPLGEELCRHGLSADDCPSLLEPRRHSPRHMIVFAAARGENT
jgi:hypothetical protein